MSEKLIGNLFRGGGKPRLLFMLILSMILLAQPAWACKKSTNFLRRNGRSRCERRLQK